MMVATRPRTQGIPGSVGRPPGLLSFFHYWTREGTFAMRRTLFFAYGIGCYLMFFATYLYLACFVGNLFVPQTIDSGPTAPLAWAIAIDAALLLAFGLQHSVMARPAFKAVW